jgi:hypothetical protein
MSNIGVTDKKTVAACSKNPGRRVLTAVTSIIYK